MNQKVKLFLYFASVFVIFTAIVFVEQQVRERDFRKQALLEKLNIYSSIAERDPASQSLPQNLRITTIGPNGRVRYENSVDSTRKLDNHFSRIEIQQAQKTGQGHDIRVSQTNSIEYLYYARRTVDGFVRVALPMSSVTQSMLASNKNFLFFALLLFVVAMIALWFISRRTGERMIRLRSDAIKSKAKQEKLKTEMTSSIAHELRTPIATIRGYTETLMQPDLTTQERAQFTERTYKAAIRLTELVRDISLLSKLDENRQLFETSQVNLYELTRSVGDEFAKLIETNSITIENQLPHNLTIQGNHTLLHSIFANLIENSIKYGGKWIYVRVELIGKTSDRLFIRIEDNGVGIEKRHLDHIFQRFYRVDTGRARSEGGSGLGLSIVRHSVLYHGGEISASRNGEGGLAVDFSLCIGRS